MTTIFASLNIESGYAYASSSTYHGVRNGLNRALLNSLSHTRLTGSSRFQISSVVTGFDRPNMPGLLSGNGSSCRSRLDLVEAEIESRQLAHHNERAPGYESYIESYQMNNMLIVRFRPRKTGNKLVQMKPWSGPADSCQENQTLKG